jgi:hypothetical protein
VAQGRRLRRLLVGVRGDERGAMAPCQLHQHSAQNQQRPRHRQEMRAQNHAIHRQIDIVAAARRGDAAGIFGPAEIDQFFLDVKVEIFYLGVIGDSPYLFDVQLPERAQAGRRTLIGDDSLLGQHEGMRVFDL